MKKIEAIIKPFKLEAVREALVEIGIGGMTTTEVMGLGQQVGQSEFYRGVTETSDMVSKIMVETVVPDSMVEDVIKVIIKSARTGRIGDGKIFVSNIEEAIRVRTEEVGEDAL